MGHSLKYKNNNNITSHLSNLNRTESALKYMLIGVCDPIYFKIKVK